MIIHVCQGLKKLISPFSQNFLNISIVHPSSTLYLKLSHTNVHVRSKISQTNHFTMKQGTFWKVMFSSTSWKSKRLLYFFVFAKKKWSKIWELAFKHSFNMNKHTFDPFFFILILEKQKGMIFQHSQSYNFDYLNNS